MVTSFDHEHAAQHGDEKLRHHHVLWTKHWNRKNDGRNRIPVNDRSESKLVEIESWDQRAPGIEDLEHDAKSR